MQFLRKVLIMIQKIIQKGARVRSSFLAYLVAPSPQSEPLEQAKITLDMKLKEVEFHLMIGTVFMDQIFAQSLYSLLGFSQNRGSKLVSCSSSPSFWFSCECCKRCTIGIQFIYRNVQKCLFFFPLSRSMGSQWRCVTILVGISK